MEKVCKIKMVNSKLFYVILALSSLIFYPVLFGLIYPLLPSYDNLKVVYDIFVIVPIITLIAGLFVAMKIERLRVFWNTVLFLVVYLSLVGFQYLPFRTLQLSQIAQSFAVFVPISVALLSLYPHKLYSLREFIYQFSIIIGTIFISFMLPLNFDILFDIVFSSHIFIHHPQWQLPDYIWFILIVMAFVLYQRSNNSNRPLLIVLTLSVFMLFQALNFAAIINAPTAKVILFIATIFNGLGFFAIYYMFYLRKRRELFDELTDLANEKNLRKIIGKYTGDFSLAIIETDNSNIFLEKYGKNEHSNVMRFISHQLEKEIDVEAFYLQDNRFALLYLTNNSSDVLWQLNSIRGKISHKKFIIRKSEKDRQKSGKFGRGKLEDWPDDIVITLSIGVVHKKNPKDTYESIKKDALDALNLAKSKGGNRCISAEDMIY
jgi:GGDEF domain-containing protein